MAGTTNLFFRKYTKKSKSALKPKVKYINTISSSVIGTVELDIESIILKREPIYYTTCRTPKQSTSMRIKGRLLSKTEEVKKIPLLILNNYIFLYTDSYSLVEYTEKTQLAQPNVDLTLVADDIFINQEMKLKLKDGTVILNVNDIRTYWNAYHELSGDLTKKEFENRLLMAKI